MSDKKKLFPTQPSLVGKKVFLRPENPDDIVNAHHWFIQSEPQAQCSHPLPFRTASEALEAHKSADKSVDRQRFTVVRKDDKTPVGRVTFFNYNSLNRSAELGVLIDPDERQNGCADDALRTLIKYLFKYRNLNKVYAETAAFNTEAIALLESIGFKRDGVLRQHYFFEGEYHDKLAYSLLLFELNW